MSWVYLFVFERDFIEELPIFWEMKTKNQDFSKILIIYQKNQLWKFPRVKSISNFWANTKMRKIKFRLIDSGFSKSSKWTFVEQFLTNVSTELQYS